MSELKETEKMKVVPIHDQTQKQLSNPTQSQKQPNRAQKSQSNQKIKSKSNVRIEGNKENENYCTICTIIAL